MSALPSLSQSTRPGTPLPDGRGEAPLCEAARPGSVRGAPEPAAGTPVAAAGSLGAEPCWAERFIARRDAARAFLAGLGLAPYRLTALDGPPVLTAWSVPGWNLRFDDSELIALARHYGWEG